MLGTWKGDVGHYRMLWLPLKNYVNYSAKERGSLVMLTSVFLTYPPGVLEWERMGPQLPTEMALELQLLPTTSSATSLSMILGTGCGFPFSHCPTRKPQS